MPRTLQALIAVAALSLAACERPADSPPELTTGVWQAVLELPGGQAPFGLEFGREGDRYLATLINGHERVSVPDVRFDPTDGTLGLGFPAFGNRIDARLVDGQLTGHLSKLQRTEVQKIPFSATPGSVADTHAAPPQVDLSGRWAVTFTEDDGKTYPAVGEFAQRGDRLFGTFLTPTADHRYLGGHVRGREMMLATFDGAHAFLFRAEVQPNESLTGEFWSGLRSHETFVATRNEDAALPDANTLTFINEGYERFEFSFEDLDGNTVSLDDERFAGKVVVVTLAGSWCPNCHDEAAFMAPLYQKYRDQGFEIVALMFEHVGDDVEAARRQVAAFRDKFDIEYVTLLAGTSDKDQASEMLPSLNAVMAFPTTIFIDATGAVRRIHTGFTGPGTGEHYTELTNEFTDYVETLLAEAAAPSTPEPADETVTDSPADGDSAGDPAADPQPAAETN
ncbi:MAG: TlpA disulfide reductase family protein [Pseudomonadota bacterium]